MFAVGVIMYTVLTGTHPFDRTNQASDSVIAQAIVQSAATATATAAAFDSDDTDTKQMSSIILINTSSIIEHMD